MKLNILYPKTPQYTNTFVVYVEFMSGDADAYQTEKYKIELQDKVLEFAVALEAMPRFYRVQDDVRQDVEMREKFPILDEIMGEDWPGDSTCDYQVRAAFDSYKICWYNGFGTEYPVEITE